MHEQLVGSQSEVSSLVTLLSNVLPEEQKAELEKDHPLYVALRLCQDCKLVRAEHFPVCGCAMCSICYELRVRTARRVVTDRGDWLLLTETCCGVPQPRAPRCQVCSSNGPLMTLNCNCVICDACGIAKATEIRLPFDCFVCSRPMPDHTVDRLKQHLALHEPFTVCARCRLPLGSGNELTLVCRHKVHAQHKSHNRDEVMCSFCGVLKVALEPAPPAHG